MDYLKIAKEAKKKMDTLLAICKEEKRVFTDEEKTEFNTLKTSFDDNIAMHEAAKAADVSDKLFTEPVVDPDNVHIEVKDKKKWKHEGEFFQAVANHAIHGTVDNRLVPMIVKDAALGANTAVPSEGGFLVESDTKAGLLKRTYEVAVVANRCTKQPIGANSNSLKRNYIDETDRSVGERWGGIRGYWIAEAGSLTATTTKLAQLETKLNKLGGLCYVTEEQLQDGVALLGSIKEDFPKEFAWLLDDAILNGNGAGQPLGLVNSAATISVAKETGQAATTIVFENIVKMWRRMWAPSRANSVWFINQDCEEQLDTMAFVVGTGGVPVYMPAGGISQGPYSTLRGRPVIPIEQAKTVGTTGDIWLVDMSQYQLIDKAGVRVDESIHVQFLTDQRAYRFIYRVGGQPIWTSALTPANSTSTLSPFIKLDARA